ncbi:hypothetical protein VFPBJ_04241 [Purpureocillium lilacinum]|uniref:Uncharacterized protein n=1 Tax=Purpureocillium lilacinum TaxID=33203 RepID=A0A179GUN0_PURLI|nr:hypothetical protein VFPBJ_04241 [Purpureocillium lilacinum]
MQIIYGFQEVYGSLNRLLAAGSVLFWPRLHYLLLILISIHGVYSFSARASSRLRKGVESQATAEQKRCQTSHRLLLVGAVCGLMGCLINIQRAANLLSILAPWVKTSLNSDPVTNSS